MTIPILATAAALVLGAAATSRTAALDAAVDTAAAQGLAGEVLACDLERTTYSRVISAPGRPHQAGELWRWASVTKQLAATLVLQEVAAGRLSLEDSVERRLPSFHGPTAGRITLKMLLQHTSGLANPDDTPAASADAMPAFYLRRSSGVGGAKDALGFCASPPKAEPGKGFAYNNCDTIVLGAILERATGKSFASLLRERISQPLGLRTLRMAESSKREPATVRGLTETGAPEPPFVLASFGPAGAAFGAAEDLLAVDRALLTNRLLTPEASRLAWTGDPRLGYVALGAWGFKAKLKGCAGGPVELVERRGEIGGVEVRNLLAPGLGRALVIFADKAGLPFGEIWQGAGLTFDLGSAAFCQ